MDFQQELNLYIRSRYPILWIPTAEEERVEAEIAATAQQVNPPRAVLYWDFVDGYTGNNAARNNPLDALEQVARAPADRPAIFVLRDFHEYLSDHSIRRKMRNVARQIRTERKTILIVSPVLRVPPELEEDVTVVDFPFASPEQIEAEMNRLLQGNPVRLESGSKEALVKACLGLTLNRVRQVLAKALASHGQVDERDIDLVLEEKKQRVRRTEVLEFYPARENMDDIGGLDVLKDWLRKRSSGFTERARRYGLPCPKGVLLAGIQGTGKSLCAKAVAQLWRLPLLRLDVGRLMGSLVGESEQRTREMIRLAEAMAPCVLWVDEIDKAFAGVQSGFQGDSGTSARVFGAFITWMQEKTSPVFLVATANNVEVLPPELLRKGRFDEIFFIGLPSERERREIFQVHLRKVREHKLREYDLRGLAAATEGYSGAEIEQAIIAAMHDAFDENREFTDQDLLRAIRETVPLSRTAREQIERLKQWAASGKARPASSDADLTPAAVGGPAPLEVDLPVS
jgi:SpoVK/Ycf46/Vps4 family AAA+-type ATPase